MQTNEEIKQEIYEKCPNLTKIKDNPNNYPIINKWNYRLLQKEKFNLFNIIENKIEERMEMYMKNNF